MRSILEAEGYKVIEAADGHAALEQFFVRRPDLVMLDLLMREMAGLEVLTKLRQMDAQARVIIATADIQSSTRRMAEQAGALAVIGKPFAAAVVLETVRHALADAPPQE
jgi:two-component system, chemotaxis family, chemotaxis protein CheY